MSALPDATLAARVRSPPAATSAATRRVMQANRGSGTGPELALRRALHRLGLRYRVNLAVKVPGHRAMRPDVVFTRARVVVFVDGCYWHGCPEHGTQARRNGEYWSAKIEINRRRDQRQSAVLREAGWTVLRFWEHDDPAMSATAVSAIVRG